MAHLTGTSPYAPGAAETKALREYVDAGGIVLIDVAGGAWQFHESVLKNVLPLPFPDAKLQPLPATHPLLAGDKGVPGDPSALTLRPYARQRLGTAAAPLQMLQSGKGQIIFSTLDLTSGLLGTHTWGILGYEPDDAQAFVQRVLLWAGRPPQDIPATQP